MKTAHLEWQGLVAELSCSGLRAQCSINICMCVYVCMCVLCCAEHNVGDIRVSQSAAMPVRLHIIFEFII